MTKRANQKNNMIDCGPLSWPRSLLSWLTIGFLIPKKTTIGKMALIVGHLCPEKNNNNIVGNHDRQ